LCFRSAVTFYRAHAQLPWEGHTYRHTDWWEGFMNYSVEMGSGAIKTDSTIQKLRGGTQTALWSHKPTYIFFFFSK
jgi:hypothetical protein